MTMEQDPLAVHRDSIYALPEFVAAANGLLADYLPKDAAGRAADEVTPRLVRFYTTEGLMPEAHKEGREARYSYKHLLSLLVVRKLLAQGFGGAAIKRAVAGTGADELEALLKEDVQLQLVPRVTSGPLDPAKAAFLQKVRSKAGLRVQAPAPAAVPAAPVEPSAPARPPEVATTWTRVTVQDGLEVLARDDFAMPDTPQGDQELLQALKVALLQVGQATKKRKS